MGCRHLAALPRIVRLRARHCYLFTRQPVDQRQPDHPAHTIAGAGTGGTRAYLVLTQVVYRIMDFSAPALSEMMVRGEKERLRHRFRQIAVLSMNMALATGAVFALCNSAFVAVWLKHKIAWPPVNDVLLAIWLVICVTMRTHIYLAGLTKKLLFMRYVFFIEGLAFVGLTLAIYRFGGIAAMLSASILCTLCLSLPYS